MARQSKRAKRTTSNLRRRGPQQEPKRRFILFCEGKNTEPEYFDAINRKYRDALISLKTYPAVGVPYTIAEKAVAHAQELGITQRSRRNQDSFEENDQVWAVFDRDEHPHYDEAVAHCEQHGVYIGRSNPCFELWLILHEQDYDKHENHHDMQKVFESLRSEYNKDSGKTPNCDEMIAQVEKAEERSERQLRNREQGGNSYGNPSTTVGRLTREIRKAAKLAGG